MSGLFAFLVKKKKNLVVSEPCALLKLFTFMPFQSATEWEIITFGRTPDQNELTCQAHSFMKQVNQCYLSDQYY